MVAVAYAMIFRSPLRTRTRARCAWWMVRTKCTGTRSVGWSCGSSSREKSGLTRPNMARRKRPVLAAENPHLKSLHRMRETGDRQFVAALARGLAILRCFKSHERYLGNQEIARRTGLAKPTVSRLTHTLS